jgi:hypothetical protein
VSIEIFSPRAFISTSRLVVTLRILSVVLVDITLLFLHSDSKYRAELCIPYPAAKLPIFFEQTKKCIRPEIHFASSARKEHGNRV